MSMVDDAHKTAACGTRTSRNHSMASRRLRTSSCRTPVCLAGRNWNAVKLAAQLKSALAAFADHVRTKDGLVNGTEPVVTRRHLISDSRPF